MKANSDLTFEKSFSLRTQVASALLQADLVGLALIQVSNGRLVDLGGDRRRRVEGVLEGPVVARLAGHAVEWIIEKISSLKIHSRNFFCVFKQLSLTVETIHPKSG